MITPILILLAATFKAIADTVMFHYDTSVFKKLPKQFWKPMESWKYVKLVPLTGYRPDAWHLANSGMIVCFVAAAVFHHPLLNWYWEILIGGIAFNTVFGLFYGPVFRRK